MFHQKREILRMYLLIFADQKCEIRVSPKTDLREIFGSQTANKGIATHLGTWNLLLQLEQLGPPKLELSRELSAVEYKAAVLKFGSNRFHRIQDTKATKLGYLQDLETVAL